MMTKDEFKRIPFFSAFTDETLPLLIEISSIKMIGANKELLTEGQVNMNLYFLMEGAVDVFVKNQMVASTKVMGTVFGEMSVVGHCTCLATVKTKMDSLFLVIPVEKIQHLSSPSTDIILKHFYKACAEILAQKLKATNQIAAAYREVFEGMKKK